MRTKHVAILALIAATIPAFADWTYDGTYITEVVDSGTAWKIKTTVSGTKLTVTQVSVVGSATELDFSSSITKGSTSYTIIGFADYAIKSKTTITKVTLPSTVTTVAKQAFYGCSNLETVTPFLPDSVTSIGYQAFSGCPKLTGDLRIMSSSPVTLNNGGSNQTGAFSSVPLIKSVTLGDGVTSIARGAFYNCSGITNIVMTDNVTSFGIAAFYGCSGISSIRLSSSLTSIGDSCFGACSALTKITLPASVTTIGTQAFSSCGALVEIKFEGSKPSSFSTTALKLNGRGALTQRFLVPDNDTEWRNFSVTACSNNDTNTYINTFGNDGTVLKGKGAPWGGNTQFFAYYSTVAAGEHSLTVASVPEGLGTPDPDFGENIIDDADLPFECTADEYAEADGVLYHCIGSTLESYVDNAWVPSGVTNSYGNGTYSYQGGAVSSHSLYWIYEPVAYQSSVSVPDGIGTVTIDTEPDANGYYAPGTVVEYGAVD